MPIIAILCFLFVPFCIFMAIWSGKNQKKMKVQQSEAQAKFLENQLKDFEKETQTAEGKVPQETKCNSCGGTLNKEGNVFVCQECGETFKKDDIQESAIVPQHYSFYMKIEDVFLITGRGTVVTGVIQKGDLRLGNTVSFSEHTIGQFVVTGIEANRRIIQQASEGMGIGVLLRGLQKDDVKIGSALVK